MKFRACRASPGSCGRSRRRERAKTLNPERDDAALGFKNEGRGPRRGERKKEIGVKRERVERKEVWSYRSELENGAAQLRLLKYERGVPEGLSNCVSGM